MKCLIVCSTLFALAMAFEEDTSSTRDQKLGPFMPGNLGTLIGTLGILKLKALFVSLLVFGVFGLLSKLLGECGLPGGLCEQMTTAPMAHSSLDYNQYGYYRSAKNENFEYSKILQELSDSLDMVDISFKTLGVQTESCKRKFVCLVDNEALENPLLRLTLNVFGKSLTKYRDSNQSKDPRDCVKLFNDCPHNFLPEEKSKENVARVFKRARPLDLTM